MANSSDWHVTQERPNWCVPACVCIALRARGSDPSQESIAASLGYGSRRGFELAAAAQSAEGAHCSCDPSTPNYLPVFRAYLNGGKLLIVQVFAAKIDALSMKRRSPPHSPHGRLCTTPFGQLHAIVLVEHAQQEFHYLDPFYSAHRQPFRMSPEDFIEAFTGEFVVVGR